MRKKTPSGLQSIPPISRVPPSAAADIAKQLRSDVRDQLESLSLKDDASFLAWWAIWGRKEYPQWIELTTTQRETLYRPLEDYPSLGGLGLNPLLRYLLAIRKDLSARFGEAGQHDYWGAVAWFFSRNVVEYELTDTLDHDTLELLHCRVPKTFSNRTFTDQCEITFLMFFAWVSVPSLQLHFPLKDGNSEKQYCKWFQTSGHRDLGLEPLMSSRRQKTAAPRKKKAVAIANNEDFGVNLIGFATGELGIGEDVRMAALCCEAASIPYRVVNIKPGPNVRQSDRLLQKQIQQSKSASPYGINIFCLTGFDTGRVFLEQGNTLFANQYNIGWWPWELPVWPAKWRIAFDLVDEIWAATDFTESMYRECTALPVHKMPLAVSVDRTANMSRSAFGLPQAPYLFLYVFDFNSYLDRKNPFAVLKAFQKAFPAKDKSVALVLKTMNATGQSPAWQAFCNDCENDSRVTLIDQTYDRAEVLALVSLCDAYVSLHRAEGFGRTLAEAMLMGKPVIATDFSGTTDFLNASTGYPVTWKKVEVAIEQYPFLEPQDRAWWADPSVANAAAQMREAKLGKSPWIGSVAVRRKAQAQFSATTIGQRMRQRLEQIYKTLKT